MVAQKDILAAEVDRRLLENADRPFFAFLNAKGVPVDSLTAGEMRERAIACAVQLSKCADPSGIVLLVMPAGVDFTVALLGCFYAGIVCVPLPVPRPGSSAERLLAVVKELNFPLILCSEDSAQAVRKLCAANADSVPEQIIVPSFVEHFPPSHALGSVLAGLIKAPSDTVLIQYTSGSTRDPKGVKLSGRNLLSNIALVAGLWQIDANDVYVTWLPHYHDMGLLAILAPLLTGGQLFQMAPATFVQRPLRWLQAMSTYKATISGAPAFAFALCLDTIGKDDLNEIDLSSLRRMFCGAEPIPRGLLANFREHFRSTGFNPDALFACYGLAESTLFVAGEPSDGSNSAIADEGQRWEPCRLSSATRGGLRVVDADTGHVLQEGKQGEIWISGDSVTRGYLGDTPTQDLFRKIDGSDEIWLRTGDLGLIESGKLYISGRKKDVFIVLGAQVAAVDVEWLSARHHPALNPHAAAAIPLFHSETPETAALVMEVRTAKFAIDDAASVAERIRRDVRAAYGLELMSIQFVRRGCLERTTSGKIRRQKVAERIYSGHLYPAVTA